jgi:ATP-binding cassette subfamily F protein 3
VVSHDRDFLQGLTTKVIEFKDHKLKEYLGDIDYFLEAHESKDMRAVELGKEKKKTKSAVESKPKSKSSNKKVKQIKNKIAKVERQIADLEADLEGEDKRLIANPELASDSTYFEDYERKQATLNDFMTNWEVLEEELGQYDD